MVLWQADSSMGENRRSQIKMSEQEIDAFLNAERTATMCSMHPDGSIHAVAMWYGLIDGGVMFETKVKSQKVQNLRRDPRLTILVEAGDSYDQLRGVELVGKARIHEDEESLWRVGVSVWERYVGPYDEAAKDGLAMMLNNRLAVSIDIDKIVSWDHRKMAAG